MVTNVSSATSLPPLNLATCIVSNLQKFESKSLSKLELSYVFLVLLWNSYNLYIITLKLIITNPLVYVSKSLFSVLWLTFACFHIHGMFPHSLNVLSEFIVTEKSRSGRRHRTVFLLLSWTPPNLDACQQVRNQVPSCKQLCLKHIK